MHFSVYITNVQTIYLTQYLVNKPSQKAYSVVVTSAGAEKHELQQIQDT